MEIPATSTPLLAAPPLSIDHSGTPVPAYVPLTTNQTLLSVPGEDRPFPRELADDSSVLSGDNALDHWLRYLIGTRTRSDNRASVMDLCADRTGRMTGGAFAAGIRGFQEFGWLLERDAARGSTRATKFGSCSPWMMDGLLRTTNSQQKLNRLLLRPGRIATDATCLLAER
jgi:hypothetical protein